MKFLIALVLTAGLVTAARALAARSNTQVHRINQNQPHPEKTEQRS
ncbi:hypothetical protein ACWEOE_37400 [Amycolatopsis sp. NPDC004368]